MKENKKNNFTIEGKKGKMLFLYNKEINKQKIRIKNRWVGYRKTYKSLLQKSSAPLKWGLSE